MAQAGRGVRLARQDLRDRASRVRCGVRRRRRRDAARARGRRRATSGACARPRTPRSSTGSRSPSRARARPARRPCSGSTRRAPHDAQLLRKVRPALARLDTDGLQIEIMDVAEATRFTLARARRGEDTISVTGNVLRDYLTDLFPILELGTSAKMLSIVPLMDGGGLFETGAGGSAPKHVQQFLAREPPALGLARRVPRARRSSLEMLADKTGNPRARLLGDDARPRHRQRARAQPLARRAGSASSTTAAATSTSPCYWAQELADQTDDAELAAALRAAGRSGSPPTRRRSSASWPPSRARPSTSAATTAPTRTRRRRRCAPARR